MELTLIVALAAAMLGGVVLFVLQSTRVTQDATGDALVPSVQGSPTAGGQQVSCTEGGADLATTSVDAGSAGVPITVTGSAGQVVVFTSSDGVVYRFVLGGDAVEGPLPLHPGSWDVACSINPGFAPAFGSGAAFIVADPDGVYVPATPGSDVAAGCAWRGILESSYERDPEAAIRVALADDGLLDSDQVEPAGYPTSGFQSYPPASDVYRVVRKGEILARVDVVRAEGQWRYSVLGCVD
ncbi:MAG TPA: hypothetical protein VI341_01345 [Actinomycetota bacterium]